MCLKLNLLVEIFLELFYIRKNKRKISKKDKTKKTFLSIYGEFVGKPKPFLYIFENFFTFYEIRKIYFIYEKQKNKNIFRKIEM